MSIPRSLRYSSTGLADAPVIQCNLPALILINTRNSLHRPANMLLAAILFAISATSFQAIAHESHGSVNLDDRFTPNIEGAVFPPQPRGATNIRIHTPTVEAVQPVQTSNARAAGMLTARSRSSAMDAQATLSNVSGTANVQAAQAAIDSTDVQALLGSRYSLLKSARVRNKADRRKNVFRVEFFSRSENRTVIATSVNGAITEVKSFAASQRQPALGEDEKALAIAIAQQYWADRNDPRLAELEAYAIQTFQPDGSPYVSRVAYVSFHARSPEPPELITWVDLSDETVFRAEVVR